MEKRTHKSHKHTSPASRSILKLHYIVIFFGLVVLVIGSTKLYQKPHVLGASVYFARGGDESPSSETDNSGSGGNSSTSGSSDSNSGPGAESSHGLDSLNSSGNSGGSVSEHALSENTLVDCVGPDGKHLTITFKACYELNHSWNRSNFTFTPLGTNAPIPMPVHTSKDAQETKTEDTQKLQVKIEGHNQKIEINKEGTKVELQAEENGLVVKAKHEDGTETTLESKDALEKLNESLKDQHVEIGTDEAKGLVIRKGEVEAHSVLPLSVDPTTNQLTVTTPAGTKTVAVLPDEAVNNLLTHNILDNVENIATGSGTGVVQNVTLTSLNNEAVFAVNGSSNKKVLGLFPVTFAKQAFVSAQTGKVLEVNETFLSKLLETFSF